MPNDSSYERTDSSIIIPTFPYFDKPDTDAPPPPEVSSFFQNRMITIVINTTDIAAPRPMIIPLNFLSAVLFVLLLFESFSTALSPIETTESKSPTLTFITTESSTTLESKTNLAFSVSSALTIF